MHSAKSGTAYNLTCRLPATQFSAVEDMEEVTPVDPILTLAGGNGNRGFTAPSRSTMSFSPLPDLPRHLRCSLLDSCSIPHPQCSAHFPTLHSYILVSPFSHTDTSYPKSRPYISQPASRRHIPIGLERP